MLVKYVGGKAVEWTSLDSEDDGRIRKLEEISERAAGGEWKVKRGKARKVSELLKSAELERTTRPKRATKYYGVFAFGSRWQAQIGIDRKMKNMGVFDTAEEAARAFDAEAVKHPSKRKGYSRQLNFPHEHPDVPTDGPKSGFHGVDAFGSRWRARIRVDGKNTYLGAFDLGEEAARVCDAEAVKHPFLKGRPRKLNFPSEHPDHPLPLIEGLDCEYSGVSASGGRWQAKIHIDGKKKYLGTFNTAEVAARAHESRRCSSGAAIEERQASSAQLTL